MRKYLVASAAFVAALFASASANAGQLVTNPSFEANRDVQSGIPGWVIDAPACYFTAREQGFGDFLYTTPPAAEGSNVLVVQYFNIPSGVACSIYQDIALPAGETATLTYSLGANYRGGDSPASSSVIRITPQVGPAVDVYTSTSAGGAVPFGAQPGVDLSAYAGQTVRVAFIHTFGTYQEAFLDNVQVNTAPVAAPVPTLSEWAMILFGTMLAGGAALFIQRRRLTA